MYLFTRQDFRRFSTSDEGGSRLKRVYLSATAKILSDRLDALGIGPASAEFAFKELTEGRLAQKRNRYDAFSSGPDYEGYRMEARNLGREIEKLEQMTFDSWVDQFAEMLNSPEECVLYDAPWMIDSFAWLMSIWEGADARFLLRAALLKCKPDEEVVLDLTRLINRGWLDDNFDPQALATDWFASVLTHGSPAVVVTEGGTDVEFLQAAVRIRYPHLSSYIRFFDFSSGAEGSAAAGIRTIKSFAAAGISNRVILLLDNDTAARDALRAFRNTVLPRHYCVLRYPEIDLARRYPTLGPNGLSEMDVNGLAGSIELYLGVDVLTGSEGSLSPVQWRSYIESMKAYQGEVMNKSTIQKRFREKVKLAESDFDTVVQQDWSGLEAVIGRLIEVLRT